MSVGPTGRMGLTEDDLREIDEQLLDYLAAGRVTPSLARRWLRADIDAHYTRGYVQERLAKLTEHEHAENLEETGVYALVDDPRDTEATDE